MEYIVRTRLGNVKDAGSGLGSRAGDKSFIVNDLMYFSFDEDHHIFTESFAQVLFLHR